MEWEPGERWRAPAVPIPQRGFARRHLADSGSPHGRVGVGTVTFYDPELNREFQPHVEVQDAIGSFTQDDAMAAITFFSKLQILTQTAVLMLAPWWPPGGTLQQALEIAPPAVAIRVTSTLGEIDWTGHLPCP